jgi:hypothetical protein
MVASRRGSAAKAQNRVEGIATLMLVSVIALNKEGRVGSNRRRASYERLR